MSTLVEEFREVRKCGCPFMLVNSPDFRASIKEMSEVRIGNAREFPCVYWDIITGHRAYNQAGRTASETLGKAEDTVSAPSLVLQRAVGWENYKSGLPKDTVLFMVFSDNEVLNNPLVSQAIANVRDSFKSNGRTLVIVGRDLKLPSLVSEDVPVWNEALPDENAIRDIASNIYEVAKASNPNVKANEADLDKAVTFLRGMTRFAVEESVARKIRTNGLDIEGLAEVQKSMVESSTNKALSFERLNFTFNDVGGQQALKDFMKQLFAGPKAPRVVVRIDEIEKAIGAGSTGPVQDNTGVAQDQLKTLLTSMEDNRWLGALFIGGPGVSKTMCSAAIGNTYKVLSLVGDLGATKTSLLGESEARIRRVMNVLYSLGGERVMLIGTLNRLGFMPPELLRRFSMGAWFFDTPDKEERKAIWKLQAARYEVSLKQALPDDEGWVGSDIRNCCERAWMLNTSLLEAAKYITIAGKVSLNDIVQLRELAEKSGFLCANYPGPYQRRHPKEDEHPVEKSGSRKINWDD
jgi:hypothetical protein